MAKILKKAELTNSGVWITTITWELLPFGKTQIVFKQNLKLNKEESYTRIEEFKAEELEQAHHKFHELLKRWI